MVLGVDPRGLRGDAVGGKAGRGVTNRFGGFAQAKIHLWVGGHPHFLVMFFIEASLSGSP